LIPGSIYRSTFFRDPKGKFLGSTPFEFVLRSIPPALIVHFIMIRLIGSTTNFEIDFQSILALMIQVEGNEQFVRVSKTLNENLDWLVLYSLSTMFIGFVLGVINRFVIFATRLDLRYKLLRIHNEWFYILYGNDPRGFLNPTFTLITIVTKNEIETSYTGYLIDYGYSVDSLKYLLLKDVRCDKRKPSNQEEVPNSKEKDSDRYMRRRHVYFDYSNILHIGFSHFQLEEIVDQDAVNSIDKRVPKAEH